MGIRLPGSAARRSVRKPDSRDPLRLRRLWIHTIRFAFWLLYNPLARMYDWVSDLSSSGLWHEWQRTALPRLGGERVLELAFGTGNMLLDLHDAGYRPFGIELSPAMVRVTRRKLGARRIELPLVRGCAQGLPFMNDAFDSVLCTFPAEFIFSEHTLCEVARVLRPGGRAVVVTMARLEDNTLWARALEWLYRATGQREPLPDLEPRMAPLGLSYQSVWEQAEKSSVLLAFMEKQVPESEGRPSVH